MPSRKYYRRQPSFRSGGRGAPVRNDLESPLTIHGYPALSVEPGRTFQIDDPSLSLPMPGLAPMVSTASSPDARYPSGEHASGVPLENRPIFRYLGMRRAESGAKWEPSSQFGFVSGYEYLFEQTPTGRQFAVPQSYPHPGWPGPSVFVQDIVNAWHASAGAHSVSSQQLQHQQSQSTVQVAQTPIAPGVMRSVHYHPATGSTVTSISKGSQMGQSPYAQRAPRALRGYGLDLRIGKIAPPK